MGQCASRKAASGALTAASKSPRKSRFNKHTLFQIPHEGRNRSDQKKGMPCTKGVAMSFGFKRRPLPTTHTDNCNIGRFLETDQIIDGNGNDDTCTTNVIPSGRTTPKLAPPKKEASATRVSRFGFRQPNLNRLDKVADINNEFNALREQRNDNAIETNCDVKLKQYGAIQAKLTTINSLERHRGNVKSINAYAQVSRYTLQSKQLPRPQYPVHVMESKAAKTLANNNKKAHTKLHTFPEKSSSKEVSSPEEDSRVSSNGGETVEMLDHSPMMYQRKIRQKQNDDVSTFYNTFYDKDLDDSTNSNVLLPQLPSAFNRASLQERWLKPENAKRKLAHRVSIMSLECANDDCVTEQPSYEINKFKKVVKHSNTDLKSQPKPSLQVVNTDSIEWAHAGEAMADDLSCTLQLSDQEKDSSPALAVIKATIDNDNGLLIDDPKFAAVAAASNSSMLLEDETSPVDSLICSYSDVEDLLKQKSNKKNSNSSNSKDVNEKSILNSSSPSTSNSSSFSDGRDFLIDDEIADQPALLFDEMGDDGTIALGGDSKVKKRLISVFERSPLFMRKKNSLCSRTVSVDTLSPCESIASDDLMLDFEQSAMDLTNRNDNLRPSVAIIKRAHKDIHEVKKDGSCFVESCSPHKSSLRSTSESKLFSSAPNSVPDLVHVLDGYQGDSSLRIDHNDYGIMIQDITSMKSLLIRLKRILREEDGLHLFGSQLINSYSNGRELLANMNDDHLNSEMTDLKRQLLFLQGQLEDKDKTVLQLRNQMTKLVNQDHKVEPAVKMSCNNTTSNAATQTERIRPTSFSALSPQSLDDGRSSLISLNEKPLDYSPVLKKIPSYPVPDISSLITINFWPKSKNEDIILNCRNINYELNY